MSSNDDLGRKFAGSAGWVFVEQWSSKLISLLLFAILARLLTPSDFGLVALATTFVVFLQVLANSGLANALVQKRSLDEKDAATVFWTSLGISVVAYGSLVLVANPLAAALGEPRLGPVLTVIGLSVPISALSRTPAALLARGFGFKKLSLRTIGASIGAAAVALPLALFGAGVWALVAQTVTEAIIAVVLLWASTTWRPSFAYSLTSLRSLWRTGLSLLGIELLDAIQSQIDKLLVGVLYSTTDLGIYSLAQRIGLMLQELTTTVVSRVSLTTFSRAQEDLTRVERIFRQLTFATATLSFPVFAMIAALATQIVPFVFGPGWDAAVPLIWIMAGGWAFASVATFDRGALVGTGNAGVALWVALIQNLASVLLVFVFAPFGVAGIAFSRFARILTWPVRLWALHRFIGLHTWHYVWQVLKCALAVAPAVVGIAMLQTTPWASGESAFWTFALPLGLAGFALSVGLNWALAGAENRTALARQLRLIFKKRGM
ncbi:lipopolysaccharide biosynthesis protein [Microbacterium sp. CFH 90308]|uniref:Lipopolysaccharide biosynthesis protein n=1 Tax=Microbacterium salsuginis TaxID=2722803 RepID=A0ABX1KBB9_9MICO|nr:lipopolysaccharide biosynthesis protein [Microbacterium sp. CFH 90308]